MTDTPPDWLLIEAAKQFKWGNPSISRLQSHYHDEAYIGYRALCEALWKLHEAGLLPAPVDRKVLCAREAAKRWGEDGLNSVSEVGAYAIELWEEGFGK
jgi:hypothetical protein